jgi:nucleoside-diphosphate-sugar epimerase
MPTALIAGGLGVTGRALVEYLEREPDWDVIALSRRTPDFPTTARFVSVDLADRAATQATLGQFSEVTHVFYCALAANPDVTAEIPPNIAMIENLLDAVEPVADLRHVQLMEGNKWYGSFLGRFRTPAKETDPRPIVRQLYHAQQDWLEERRAGKAWTWSALRPHGVWGLSVGGAMNLLTSVALYATVSKHLGLPLCWPGSQGFYDRLYNIIDVELLAKAMLWCATTPAAADNAFNINNGDFFRWHQVWPRIAGFFEMEVGPVRTISQAALMADKEPLWAEIVAQHGLRPYTLADLTNFAYADRAMSPDYDQMASMTKIRQAGWTEAWDTEETITRQLERLRRDRIIP